jgi:hypothetical protein
MDIAEDVRGGRQKIRALHPHTQQLVARELHALNTGRPEIAASIPLVLDGVASRYRALSAEAIEALSEQRTPIERRAVAPAGPVLRIVPGIPDPVDVVDAEWFEDLAA